MQSSDSCVAGRVGRMLPVALVSLLAPPAIGQNITAPVIASFGPNPTSPVKEPAIAAHGEVVLMAYVHDSGTHASYKDPLTQNWIGLGQQALGGTDPSIAWDAVSNRFVLCMLGVQVSRFDPSTLSFPSGETNISIGTGGDKPWIVSGRQDESSDELYIFGTTGDFAGKENFYARTTTGGASTSQWTWDTISASGAVQFGGECAIAGPTGDHPLYAAYVMSTGQAKKFRFLVGTDNPDGTMTFGHLTNVLGTPLTLVANGLPTGNSIPGPFLAKRVLHPLVDPTDENRLFLIYQDSRSANASDDVDIKCARLDRDQSGAWSIAQIVTVNSWLSYVGDDADQCVPGATIDSSGRIHVIYYDDRRFNQSDNVSAAKFDMYYAASTDHGSSFTEHQINSGPAILDYGLNLSGEPGEYPGIAVNATNPNQLWVAFMGSSALESASNDQSVIYVSRITYP